MGQTKNPSKSGCAASSLQFAPFTEPKRPIYNVNKLVPQLHKLKQAHLYFIIQVDTVHTWSVF